MLIAEIDHLYILILCPDLKSALVLYELQTNRNEERFVHLFENLKTFVPLVHG